jgi:polysaccharide biosynthesis/export protein
MVRINGSLMIPAAVAALLLLAAPHASQAQGAPAATAAAASRAGAPAAPVAIAVPADYVIGPADVLSILFWREKDLSGDVAVRPDGHISLLLLNDVQAAGLTPEQLRLNITAAADKFITDPTVTVVVKEIHSRNVFVVGQVAKPGSYPLAGPTSVMQLLSLAGGPVEYGDSEHISIMRVENGRQVAIPFNYKEVLKRKNLKQNIDLKPGDIITIP